MIKVMVSNTDDATGLAIDGRQPQNRNRKGPATDRAISMNQGQLNLFEDFDEPANVIRLREQEIADIQHWFLCIYCEENVVRSELSFPAICKGGFFTTYHKRIILIGDEDNGGPGPSLKDHRDDSPEGESEFEIPVVRKQA